MKLVRFGEVGAEKPGLIDEAGQLRDLSSEIGEIDGLALDSATLAKLSSLEVGSLPVVGGSPRLGCPVANVGKFVGIGLNYTDHALEAKMPIPAEPIVFMKATSSIQGPNDSIMLPRGSKKTDWEVELGIVIGTKARYVPVDEALDYVAGYTVVNDVSEREYQIERGSQWDKGKGCDTFGPIGPYLVTKEEVGDVQSIDLWLDVNGVRRQSGNTRTMIFGVAKIVSYVSEFMTLMPGDVITSGTPPGVGMGFEPPQFLKAGDEVALGIEKLGAQRQVVVDFTR